MTHTETARSLSSAKEAYASQTRGLDTHRNRTISLQREGGLRQPNTRARHTQKPHDLSSAKEASASPTRGLENTHTHSEKKRCQDYLKTEGGLRQPKTRAGKHTHSEKKGVRVI